MDALSRVEIHISESLQNNVSDLATNSSIATVHSASENLDDGIAISERPLNEFTNQLVLAKNSCQSNPKMSYKIFFNLNAGGLLNNQICRMNKKYYHY